MNKRLIASIAIMATGLLLLIIFSIVVYKTIAEPSALDVAVRDMFYNSRGEKNGFGYWFFRLITEFGGFYFVAVLGLAALVYTRFDYRLIVLGGVLLLEVAINAVLKHSFDRERPTEELRWMEDYSSSFPSGHSGISIAWGLTVSYFLCRLDLKKYIKIIIASGIGLIVVLVMISRLVLGMHYFSDIVAGASLGLFASGAGILASYFLEKYNILQKPLIKISFKKNKDEETE